MMVVKTNHVGAF